MDIAELQRWVGKYVRTERPCTSEEAEHYGTPVMGGEGVVERIFQGQDGEIWLQVDWGMGWTLTEDTVIQEVEPVE
jgi:hypothetical protein